MRPKIGYLVDESAGWDGDPSWKFYTEKDVPDYIISSRWRLNEKVKRIVYWEVE